MSSDPIRPTIRPDTLYDIRDYFVKCIEAYEGVLVRNCLTCTNFVEHGYPNNANGPGFNTETCRKYGARPPARVIAYGCPSWFNEDEIPF